jgi:serine/threonine-protein kinase
LWHDDAYFVADEDTDLSGVPEPGEVVVGKYRVERVLGIGGMGCVVAATHVTLDQPVAIKFLLAKAARNPKNVTRFTREAQAAARIKSDHVTKVSDVGVLESGTPYMVMEYLAGQDMSERLQRGALPFYECVDYVLEACEALAEAHQLGIVHRDLKPANLYLATTSDGSTVVKVLDFGISKFVSVPGQGADLTKTSALMGSPLYMSPEQMMSAKAADGRADIWALGCILFEGMTAQPPFVGETLPEICSRILTSPPTKLRQLEPSVPPPLETVIERCLAKAPEERYQNLGELASALCAFGTERSQQSVKVVHRVLGMRDTATSTPSPVVHAGSFAGTPAPGTPLPGTPLLHSFAASAPQPRGPMPSAPQPLHPAHPGHVHDARSGYSTGGSTPVPLTVSGGVSSGSLPNAVLPPALAHGALTGAPVAQTMNEHGGARRSRSLVFVALAVVVLGVGGAGVFLLRGRLATPEVAASTAEPTSPPPAESQSTREPALAELTPPAPSEAPTSSATPPPASATSKIATAPPKSPSPGRPPAPAPEPAPTGKTGHQVKQGDDLFNTLK